MKTVATALAGILATCAMAATDKAPQNDSGKNVEVTVAAAFPTGDVKDQLNGDTGWMLGIDSYWNSAGMNMGKGTNIFFGGRAFWVGADADMKAIGAHVGLRFDFQTGGMGSGVFYAKVAGGYYSSNFDVGGGDIADTGFGGFAALGYSMTGHGSTPWGLEVGYYWLPSVTGIDNTGWYAGATFRF